MLIYEALKKDHDKVKDLLSQLVSANPEDSDHCQYLVEQIRNELIPHSRAEEAVFYNYLRDIDLAKDLVRHSYREHLEAEALLRTLQAMKAMDVDWSSTAKKLRDAVEHHISEEENNVFPAAHQILIDEEASLMADAFERLKPEVRDGSFMQNTLDLIANMLPESLARPIRSFNHPNA